MDSLLALTWALNMFPDYSVASHNYVFGSWYVASSILALIQQVLKIHVAFEACPAVGNYCLLNYCYSNTLSFSIL